MSLQNELHSLASVIDSPKTSDIIITIDITVIGTVPNEQTKWSL